jgi:hypothetical protein
MSRAAIVVSFLTMSLAATAALGQLAKPQVTNVSVTNGIVNVTGVKVSGAASYTFLARHNGTILDSVTSLSPAASFQPSKLPPNTRVDVSIVATATNGETAPSDNVAAVTAPLPPTGIIGTPGRNRVTVSWTAAAGAASYRVTLSNGMSFTTTSTSYTFTGLETATSYNCVLRSYNSAGAESALSPVVVVKTANIATVD